MEKNMYQEAIADAKAVRASALANAKAAIQEAFEPKLQEMIKKTMEEEDYTEGMDEPMEEETSYEGGSANQEYATNIDEDTLEETTLEEILAELEADGTESMEDGEKDDLHEAEEEEGEEEEETETETETEEEGGEEPTDETKVVDITLGDLVDAIKAAMGSEKGMETMPEPEMGGGESDEISLDEILAEINEEDVDPMYEKGDYMEEAKKKKAKEDMSNHKKELEEANATIEEMRKALNETNLLNAKLLYVNKIFKSKTLSEAQKVKVLNSFDKATTVKETKTVYETLMEAMQAPKKTALKESIGFASKAAGANVVKKTLEADPFITRMQQLAGII